MKAAGRWLALSAALGAAAMADPPTPPTPPATTVGVPAPGNATPGTTPVGGTPDDEFIEFLGADDDAVRWDLTNSAQRKGRSPAAPRQDATP